MVNTTPTGETGNYISAYDYAAQVLITARVNDGDDYITLDYLYKTLGANDVAKQTAVRWGRNACRVAGLITKSGVRGVYRVVK